MRQIYFLVQFFVTILQIFSSKVTLIRDQVLMNVGVYGSYISKSFSGGSYSSFIVATT